MHQRPNTEGLLGSQSVYGLYFRSKQGTRPLKSRSTSKVSSNTNKHPHMFNNEHWYWSGWVSRQPLNISTRIHWHAIRRRPTNGNSWHVVTTYQTHSLRVSLLPMWYVSISIMIMDSCLIRQLAGIVHIVDPSMHRQTRKKKNIIITGEQKPGEYILTPV